ncbi:hypothetical protein O181_022653 [Austropuccinia psidii MF-1]|uniref:Integrase catalytic domain-containing protein n=1 Tax=Austropuccinia psidii MF-1 TaxID=1389203 RepID=A0A9Q3CHA8_9BASI|nr:hypothetical protein [Austropuccinia psidii MF-1]
MKRFRTNNAGELNTTNMKKFFSDLGITHENTIPYEHHQAREIERTNQTIAEEARSQLGDSDLPENLWPHAFLQVVWVFNRVLHSQRSRKPYELVVGCKPDLTPLQVFGCTAFVHNINHRKDLSPKAKDLIQVGIAEDFKGWVFWNKTSNMVLQSATPTFHEAEVESHTPVANAIEINYLFDPTMLQEIDAQDAEIQETVVICHLNGDTPKRA